MRVNARERSMPGFVRSWGKIIAAILAVLIVLAIWYLWPVYGFFSHRGAAPLGPIGWSALPSVTAPVTHETLNPRYNAAGEEAARRLEGGLDRVNDLTIWRRWVEARNLFR